MNSIKFEEGLKKLGFNTDDDSLFLTEEYKTSKDYNKLREPQIAFHVERAAYFEATALYLRKQLNGSYKPQVYLYDFTGKGFNENELTEIQKKIWSSGEVPLVCVFYDTEIKIIDCTTHIKENNAPAYIFESLKATAKAKKLYDNDFAVKIKSGIFWEEKENKKKFDFKNSSYDRLIENIRIVVAYLKKEDNLKKLPIVFINKIIIQSILIKYLEERIDKNEKKLLSDKFFKKYNSKTFNDVLRNGKFLELLEDLNNPKEGFNGNVFDWSKEHKLLLKNLDLSILADLLDTNKSLKSRQGVLFPEWRYFEFKDIPVELISRLYEEFLASTDDPNITQEEKKKKKGTFYTPSHLVKLLVDEALPLKKYKEIDLDNYEILDPSCGSGIFLVIVFKRLVQLWRLQNNMDFPDKDDLKKLLKNIYGIDIDEQAVQLASFSLCLALCNELEPIEIIQKLKFDNLSETNIIPFDFFDEHKLSNKKFDLIIGNPPFVRGGAKEYKDKVSLLEGEKVSIPNNQLALKFLIDSYSYLKPNGLQCLILKSADLLYNSTSNNFTKKLFQKTNILQILDFTALARNQSLWDNKEKSEGQQKKILEVDTLAIFTRNARPDFHKNILHLTFRRTKATKERIVFEIDDYDLHFVNRQTVIENPLIWKNNLLGGGRIKTTIEKLSRLENLDKFKNNNSIICGEGIGGPKSLPNDAFLPNGIDESYLNHSYNESFKNKKDLPVFSSPNILIKENLELPYSLNNKKIKFNNEIVGFHSENIENLKTIFNSFKYNHSIFQFYITCTSGKMLVYKNTACKKEDILNLPFQNGKNLNNNLSEIDKNIIKDVNEIMQLFLRNGENSKAVKPIHLQEIESILKHYGKEFSKILNLIYEEKEKKFRLSDVITLSNSYIVTIFKYDDKRNAVKFHNDTSNLNANIIEELSNYKISQHLNSNRIIKLYPEKDTIVFIKPNQYRYWLSLIAYRDADKCFSDLSKAGY